MLSVFLCGSSLIHHENPIEQALLGNIKKSITSKRLRSTFDSRGDVFGLSNMLALNIVFFMFFEALEVSERSRRLRPKYTLNFRRKHSGGS